MRGAREPLHAFMPYGPAGASGRVRVIQWLEHTGTSAELHDYAGMSNNRPKQVLRHLPAVVAAQLRTSQLARRQYDRVLIHREASPFSSGGLIERIAGGAGMSVYDFDDALMWSPPSRRAQLWSKAENCRRAVVAVDRVIAGSEVLAEWAQGHNSDVRLIPTCVEPGHYALKVDYELHEIPRLVWLGSPGTEPYLAPVADALLEVHRLTSARLTVISAGRASLGPVEAMVDRVTWRPGIERLLDSFDAAIAPLVDGPWERGKCAYKILQYGAAGLPSVVSPVGANKVAAERLGLLTARDHAEWVTGTVDLLSAAGSERRRIGITAREGVERHYSYSRWAPDWLEAVGQSPHQGPARVRIPPQA